MKDRPSTIDRRFRTGTTASSLVRIAYLRRDDTRGFTLGEVIVGLALLGLFMLMGVGIVRAAYRLLPGAGLSVEGETLPIAPSPAAYADSVRLHGVLIERFNAARAIYVLGGRHSNLPASASRLNGAPLALSALPNIADFSRGLPMDAYGFYQLYAAQLGPLMTASSAADFTIIVIGPAGGGLAVTALVQVRERAVTLEDPTLPSDWVRRETILYDISGDVWRCAFVEKAMIAASATSGATHFWHRYDEGRVAEEGAVMTVFPDPWRYAGTRDDPRGEPPPFSRFTYFLAVSP